MVKSMKYIGCQCKQALALLVFVVIMSAPLSSMAGPGEVQDPTQSPGDVVMAGGAAAPAGPVLQSVMMSSGRKVAVISGQMLRVGEKFGEATLIRVTDHDVSLRNADGSVEVLKMHPAVEKKIRIQPREQVSGVRKTKRTAGSALADETR